MDAIRVCFHGVRDVQQSKAAKTVTDNIEVGDVVFIDIDGGHVAAKLMRFVQETPSPATTSGCFAIANLWQQLSERQWSTSAQNLRSICLERVLRPCAWAETSSDVVEVLPFGMLGIPK